MDIAFGILFTESDLFGHEAVGVELHVFGSQPDSKLPPLARVKVWEISVPGGHLPGDATQIEFVGRLVEKEAHRGLLVVEEQAVGAVVVYEQGSSISTLCRFADGKFDEFHAFRAFSDVVHPFHVAIPSVRRVRVWGLPIVREGIHILLARRLH